MATQLKKPVVREVTDWCRKGLFGLGGTNKRSLLVSVEPGPFIVFRLKGLKKRYEIDLETVYNLAVRVGHAKVEAEKRKLRKEARKGRSG